jgi:hypothetical protein
MNNDLLVDFDDENVHSDDQNMRFEQQKEEKKILYMKEYNKHTTEFYRNMREKKYNIISHDSFDCDIDYVFQFPFMWDPYTGEITEKDPHGPLYFHPDELIHFFYKRRLKMLWHEPKDENGGFYEGYYGDAVGSGEEINIPGRGIYPELYLFRLPIDDCYLSPDSDLSVITMGPRLTDKDVELIDELAEKYHKNNFQNCYRKKRPSLVKMKKLYDTAISKNPDITKYGVNLDELSDEKISEFKNRANREAVDALIKL